MQDKVDIHLDNFFKVAEYAKITISQNDVEIEYLPAPHIPKGLPPDKMAVYIFFDRDKCLKVGKVGSKSSARYLSQHYNPDSSKSNLAKSLIYENKNLCKETVANWMKQNLCRVNILLDHKLGITTLNLLESYFQCVLNPYYEGFKSQKV